MYLFKWDCILFHHAPFRPTIDLRVPCRHRQPEPLSGNLADPCESDETETIATQEAGDMSTSEIVDSDDKPSNEDNVKGAPANKDETPFDPTKHILRSPRDRPLHNAWTLWYDNPRLAPPNADWSETLKTCGSFNTVGGFWSIYNNVKPSSLVSVGSNYSVFRYGTEPSWEDPANINGGKFVFTIPKKEVREGKCDRAWLLTVLAVIGETLDATGDQVCGAVVSIRKAQNRVALWLKSSERDVCRRIGTRWKLAMEVEQGLRYQTHKDAAESGRSFRNEVQFHV